MTGDTDSPRPHRSRTSSDGRPGPPLTDGGTVSDGEATSDDGQDDSAPDDGEASSPDGRAGPSFDGGERGSATLDAVGGSDVEQLREYLLKGALGLLALLGVVATVQFYLSGMAAIAQLAASEFQPLFEAAFNLVVLLAVGVGIAQVLRRLR